MNGRMSDLLQKTSLRWPLERRYTLGELPSLEIFEECVLLKDPWVTNKPHAKITSYSDKTEFECFINHVHLPFDGTSETLTSCLGYAASLQEVVMPLTPDRQFRVIISLQEDDASPKSACTVRFHRIRPGENSMPEDLEEHKSEAILIFEIPS